MVIQFLFLRGSNYNQNMDPESETLCDDSFTRSC